MPRQEIMTPPENGDGEGNGARMSGRAKPKKDYSLINRGTSSDFSKGAFPAKGNVPLPTLAKSASLASAKQRGIQVNNQVMKKCCDMLKAIKDVCRHPDLMQAVTEA